MGMKSRGVYETPGGTILLTAHRGIESICLDRGEMHLKVRMRGRAIAAAPVRQQSHLQAVLPGPSCSTIPSFPKVQTLSSLRSCSAR